MNETQTTGLTQERSHYDHSYKRLYRLFMFWLTNTIPFSRFKRADLYRKLGVDIEQGTVRLGTVQIDTLHPERIHIGKGTAIANGCILLAHFYNPHITNEHAFFNGDLTIGRNCYIGSNTIFSKSVKIGDGAVIGAGSVVTKDVPPYEIWAGVPAHFISKRYDDGASLPDVDDFKPR